MRQRRRCIARIALAVLAVVLAPAAPAQPYPARPISMVVVFAAGGTADIVGRTLAAQLSTQLVKQVVVDNKPGAGGTIGATAVARSKPDGYTILMLVSTHTTAETLFKGRQYDLLKDFAPVTTIGTSAYWVLVNPEVTKANTMQELVATMRANPGKMTYASGGSGGITHLASEMMKLQGKLDVVHIPFKGNAPALTELMAGRVDMLIDQPASSEAFVKAGKLKPLAVTSRSRLPTAPSVPTMSESGFPGFEAIAWFGLGFPAGTPAEIVDRMNREVATALATPELKQKLEAAGITPLPMSPAQFTELIKSDIARWRTVINDAKITAE
ncbi:MAG: tripartite tricarboxylate transporter substrate binding protein [Pseudomonadota bacterium]|nr:tripartite tricarboxylate transporter substrate binding protein [Pseudomonadota bacterium]